MPSKSFGADRYLMHLMDNLVVSGVNVSLLLPRANDYNPSVKFPPRSVHSDVHILYGGVDSLHTVQVPFTVTVLFFWHYRYDGRRLLKFAVTLYEKVLAKRAQDKAVARTLGETVVMSLDVHINRWSGAQKEEARDVEARVYAAAERVVSLTQADSRQHLAMARLINASIEPERFSLLRISDDLATATPVPTLVAANRPHCSVLFVGAQNIANGLSVRFLCHALARLTTRAINRCAVTLYLGGDDRRQDVVQEFNHTFARNSRIVNLGRFNYSMESLMVRMRVATVPTLLPDNDTVSGVATKVMHALLVGLPVVTTRAGAAGLEAHVNAPFLRVADTHDEFADAVYALCALDDDQWLSLAHRARTFARRFFSFDSALRTSDFYHRFLKCQE